MAKSNNARVFVYGTLKAGHPNHSALENSELLGACYLDGRYTMLDLGWYPAVVDSGTDETSRIYGEVYSVDEDTLYTLDCIEGHPDYYTRRKVDTPWKGAWMYFLPASYRDKQLGVVQSGVWRPSAVEQAWVEKMEQTRGSNSE